MAADAALLVAYGEGDAGQLAVGAGARRHRRVRRGAAGWARPRGRERTATACVSTATADGPAAVALGAVHAGSRPARCAARVVPGTPRSGAPPSALSVARRRGRWRASGPALGAAGPGPRWRTGSGSARDAAVGGVSAAARQRVDRAFLDDWRLATANGPQAQRMYAAGATLEVTRALKPGEGTEGGGNVR